MQEIKDTVLLLGGKKNDTKKIPHVKSHIL